MINSKVANFLQLNSGNQGVYACIDEKSGSDVYFVYVLMAMLPPVNIPDELTTPENQQSLWNFDRLREDDRQKARATYPQYILRAKLYL